MCDRVSNLYSFPKRGPESTLYSLVPDLVGAAVQLGGNPDPILGTVSQVKQRFLPRQAGVGWRYGTGPESSAFLDNCN